MNRRLPQLLSLFGLLTLLFALGPRAVVAQDSTGTTTRVSVSSSGVQGNWYSTIGHQSISADGRFVAFLSHATTLVAGDTNGVGDVFVHDRQTGVTTRVSVSSAGAQGNGAASEPAVSADGRFVAFTSYATNLVTGDSNGWRDIFVHDRQTGATTRVSVSSGGAQGDYDSWEPSLSADGRFVTFTSAAANLVTNDTNGAYDAFVHDRQTGVTTRVSVSSAGAQGDSHSAVPAISADGRFVAFVSRASNLVIGDTNEQDAFVHDRQTGATTLVSVSSGGVQGNGLASSPSLSADGRFVVFSSYATNLVVGDTNGRADVFVHDQQTGTTNRVSVSSAGAQGDYESSGSSLSADGRFVAFSSVASNLVTGDTNGRPDAFVHDRQTGATTRVSVSSGGVQGNGLASSPSLSADGRFVVFSSDASNLVTGDTNGRGDVFVHFTATPTGNVPTVLLQEAQSLFDSADDTLAGAEVDALGVIEEVIYFRGAVVDFSLKLVADLLDTLQAAASNTSELPIHEAFPGWKKAVLKSPTFCKLSNAFVSDVSEAAFSEQAGLKRATRLALNSGLYALAAYNENKCLGDLQEDLILDSVGIGNLLLAHLERPFAQTPVARKIADSRAFLDQQLAILQAAKVPPMSQTVIDGYVADLRARKFANTVYRDQLHDALLTLEAIHAANEAEPWGGDVLQLTLRSAAKFGAEWVADGPGRAAVNGTLLLFDSYMDHKALLESYRMLLVANSTLLKTAPEVVQKVTDNIDAGLAQIAAGQGPNLPHGSILGVKHYSGGQYLDPLALWWQEREAYSWVTIKNTGATPGDFYVVGRYQGETTRLTLPWANLWLRASSDPVRLLPGQSTPVQLIYRTGDLGYSPREARSVVNVPASSISVDLLGVNETGTFHLDFYSNEWQPARATMTNGVMTFVAPTTETEAAVIDEVLVSAIDGGPGQDYQTGFLWVNNPFDATVPIVLSQPLPGNVTVLDSGGGNITASEIAWSGTVGPLETGFFEYTMEIDSPPGTAVTFAAATLEITAPGNQALTITGEEQVVTMPWPVLIDRDTPDWIPPHTAATLTINAANFAAEPVNGVFTVEVWTAAGQQVQREEKPLAVGAESDQQLTFDWPDTLDIGDYEVRGFLILDGNEGRVFADPVAVGAPPPHLSLSVSPINDDGTVALGGVLDYTFTIENAGDMALTNVMTGITLPADMEVIAISDSGARAGAEVRWPLDTIPAGAFRTLTVQARVPLDFAAPNEGRYLESTPFLTADESPDATGAALRVLVLGPEGVTPPTITSFTPTTGPAGSVVTISGTTFTGTTAVTFNGVNAGSFTVDSATHLMAVVPTGATTGKIAVTTLGGTATSTADFTVISPPMISGFNPTSGPVGTSVTVSGTAFSGAAAVTFNGVNATSFTVNSATQITAVVPTGATTGKIAVTTPGGTATSAADFTVTIPPAFPDVFYLSPSANVTVGGIAAQGADVLRYTKSTNSWTMVFDGSNHGLTKNVSALTFLDDGSLLFVLAANQAIDGLGTVTPFDVVKFTPNTPGVFPLGTGTFSWYFQGKPKGLTTTGEKIDAIDVVGSRLFLSIAGGGSVPRQGGGVLKPADEDVFVWNMGTNAFEATLLIDGSKMTGMGVEDISGVWDDPQSGDYYITIVGAFNLGGVKGNDKSIVKLSPNGGASVYTPSLVTWLTAGATLPSTFKIDGIELVR